MLTRPLYFALPLAAAFALAIGCGKPATAATPSEAETSGAVAFLKWSMDQHERLRSYQAQCDWTVTQEGVEKKSQSKRTLQISSPNRFRVTSDRGDLAFTSVSDGERLIEYTSDPKYNAQSYEAPANVSRASGVHMRQFQLAGSPLYTFFEGSSAYDRLVDSSNDAPAFDGEETVGGETAKVVRFYGAGQWGNVRALIGEKTGIVHRLEFDLDPLVQRAWQQANSQRDKDSIKHVKAIETYTNIKLDEALPGSTFDASAPKDYRVQTPGQPKAPVAVGEVAPDFAVKNLGGRTVKLSDFRGKVVLIDFWATWCGPCREAMPELAKMRKDYASQLAVLSISSEDKAVIEKFDKEERHGLDIYNDPDESADLLYDVQMLPTYVVLDAQGRLVDYLPGGHGKDRLLQSLRKAGLRES